MKTKREEVLQTGFTCECGEFHKYPAYVYAHWDERLLHTCEKCDRQHAIRAGNATLIKSKGRSK